MISVRQSGSESEGVDTMSRVFVPLKHLEKRYNEGLIIETEMSFIKPWEPGSHSKAYYGCNSHHEMCEFMLGSQTEKVNSPSEPIGSKENIDPSEFELSKENDVLYPSIATLPHINLDSQVRLCVVGVRDVGKSALAMRFLSGQQSASTGEVNSDAGSRVHRPRLSTTQSVEVDIIDVPLATKDGDEPWVDKVFSKNQDLNCQKSSLVLVVMYSITDRNSFHVAAECLQAIRSQSLDVPILVLANKGDLSHLRQVCLTEGRNLSRQFDAAFHEVSVANCPEQPIEVLYKLIKHLRHTKKTSQIQPPSNSMEVQGHQSAENGLPEPDDNSTERSRKFSVFNTAGRMLNNLMLFGSRSSMPPDLRPISSSTAPPVMSTTRHDWHNNHDNFLFKNVFKKRSV